jgi:hypothetical protein
MFEDLAAFPPVMPAKAGIHDFGMEYEGHGAWPGKQVVDARFRGHDGIKERRRYGGLVHA